MIQNQTLTRVIQASLILVTLAAIAYRLFWPQQFTTVFAREDGWIEYGTAFGLVLAGVALFLLGRRVTGYRKGLLWIYAAVMVLAAGEEISWGQRIFDIESSDYFLENNVQGEINFHNLEFGGEQIASFFLGQLVTLVALLYLIALPLLHPRAAWVRKLADLFAVPVPPVYAVVVALGWSVLVVWIDLPRNWEVYEYVLAAVLCLIFVNPANRATFNLT